MIHVAWAGGGGTGLYLSRQHGANTSISWIIMVRTEQFGLIQYTVYRRLVRAPFFTVKTSD